MIPFFTNEEAARLAGSIHPSTSWALFGQPSAGGIWFFHHDLIVNTSSRWKSKEKSEPVSPIRSSSIRTNHTSKQTIIDYSSSSPINKPFYPLPFAFTLSVLS